MKRLTAILLFCFLFLLAKADTFTVTSNADSGPGTLREAITLANDNGTVVTDSIVFNLPGNTTADHTIVISGMLPPFSDNLVLDGTTQPGSFFGISHTKVILKGGALMCNGILISHVKNIAVYGIWFKDFQYIDNLSDFCHGEVFLLNSVSNLTIGKPGKGNAFSTKSRIAIAHKSYEGIDYQHPTVFADSISIEDNIFSLNDEATGIDPTAFEQIAIWNGRNVKINANNGSAHFSVGSAYPTGNGYLTFTNNNFSNPYGIANARGSLAVAVEGVFGTTTSYDLLIENNRLTNDQQYCIILWDLAGGQIQIRNNDLGARINLRDSADLSFCIGMFRCKSLHAIQVVNNTMANRQYGVYTAECKKIFLSNNSIYCTKKGLNLQQPVDPLPVTSIREITPSVLSGVTSSNAKLELFFTDSCSQLCENGKSLVATGVSDATGNFSFSVNRSGTYSITATLADSTTSEFNGVKVNLGTAQVKHAVCGENNGSITGVKILNAASWYWEDTLGRVISHDTDLVNLAPGRYRMVLQEYNVSCPTVTPFFEVLGFAKPDVDVQQFSLLMPTCGLANGELKLRGPKPDGAAIKWYNADNSFVQYGVDSLSNLPMGTYYCKIFLWQDSSCFSLYGPFNLINQSGPSLNRTQIKITPATCSNSNGSITGITATNVTGTASLQWLDSLDNIVGNGYDLQTIPPGRYRLKFKDEGGCNAIVTPFYTVGNTGEIIIDTTGMIVSPAKCTGAAGSIQNILVTGGDSYTWKNSVTGATVGNALNVSALSAGNYLLTVGNSFGCSKTLSPITVPQAAFVPIQVLNLNSAAATCGRANGFVEITQFSRDTSLYTFRWVDSASGQIISRFTNLYNVPNGTYFLFAKDSNGCEGEVLRAFLLGKPDPSFDYTNLQVIPDNCLSGSGAIQGLAPRDLSGGVVTYVWRNSIGDSVGNTLNIKNLAPGTYQLTVTDGAGCTAVSQPISVGNTNTTLPAPQYNEQTILKNTAATLTVKNRSAGTYQLFDDPFAATLIGENNIGDFTTPVLTADETFYVRLVSGVCQSDLVPVTVKVIDKTAIYVPTAFTPNGDGKNDVLRAIAYGRVKLSHFTIYNRWGQVVFSTENFNKGWNGTIQGKPAETGVFVWIIKATDELSGRAIEQKGTVLVVR